MALTDAEKDTLNRLYGRLQRDLKDHWDEGVRVLGLESLGAYREGEQRLVQLGIAVPEALREFVTIVNWPGTYVSSVVARMRPQGFTLDGDDAVEKELNRRWQANNMDTEIRMALDDMLTYGRGYLASGKSEDDDETPLFTVESPLEMIHEWSNRRRKVTAVARFYTEKEDGKTVRRATLYLPNSTIWCHMGPNGWTEDADQPRDDHELGRVGVEPLVNRAASGDRYGRSEILGTVGLTDAAARALTNAQIATEVVALPQKYAAGMSQADFKDPKTGEMKTEWEAYIGSIWATSNKDAKFGQFSAADLANFKTIVSLYAQLVAGVTGLPMRYLGQMSDNPPSADGIRADEARLVGTAEEKILFADGPLENLQRQGDRIATLPRTKPTTDLQQMEVVWRNPGTPSVAQATDAAVKNHAQRLISRKQALRDMGYTPQQIRKILEELADEDGDPALGDAVSALREQRERPALTGGPSGTPSGV